MKNSRTILCALIILTAAISPLLPRAHADIANFKWVNTAFSGNDPFYGSPPLGVPVSAYQTGSTATLLMQVTTAGSGGSYINVTAAKLMMDWNGNYTATG